MARKSKPSSIRPTPNRASRASRARDGFAYFRPEWHPVRREIDLRTHRVARHPACMDRRVDLRQSARTPAGHGQGRAGPQAVSLSPGVDRRARLRTSSSRSRDFARVAAAHPARRRARPATTGVSKERVLARVVRLMDRAFIRVGGERYRRENGSFGATTLRNRHVRKAGDAIVLDFRGKSGKRHTITIDDDRVVRVDPAVPRPAGRRPVPVQGRRCRALDLGRRRERLLGTSPAATSRARTSARGAARCARRAISRRWSAQSARRQRARTFVKR